MSETIVDATRRTLGEFQGFTAKALDGIENEEPKEPRNTIGTVFAQASGQLITELLVDHAEHLPEAIRDVIYGLTGIAVRYGLDLEQIVSEGVTEYERRAEEARLMREIFAEFAAMSGTETSIFQGEDDFAGILADADESDFDDVDVLDDNEDDDLDGFDEDEDEDA